MTSIRRRVAALLALLVMTMTLVVGASAQAAPGEVITISDPQLATTASLATDFDRQLYWTANAGPGSEVFAVDETGAVAGSVTFDAQPQTIEGLAMFEGLLHVADIGDPQLARDSVSLFRLEEPFPGVNSVYSQWQLHYPDGPHDAKAFMVSPRGNFWVVTFGSPGGLYYAQAPASGSGDLYLEYAAEAPDWVTDATFIDAETAVLRTYTGLITFNMFDYTATGSAPAPQQPRGESVSAALDGDGVLLGSQGDQRLVGAAIPATLVDVPPAAATPPASEPQPTGTPSAEPSATPAPTDQPGSRLPQILRSSKTLAALGIAAAVSLAAGLVAYFARERDRSGSGR